MRELRRQQIGESAWWSIRKNRYTVTIEVCGPQGTWEDISLIADRDLALHTASLCYRLRLTEQQSRAIEWSKG